MDRLRFSENLSGSNKRGWQGEGCKGRVWNPDQGTRTSADMGGRRGRDREVGCLESQRTRSRLSPAVEGLEQRWL